MKLYNNEGYSTQHTIYSNLHDACMWITITLIMAAGAAYTLPLFDLASGSEGLGLMLGCGFLAMLAGIATQEFDERASHAFRLYIDAKRMAHMTK